MFQNNYLKICSEDETVSINWRKSENRSFSPIMFNNPERVLINKSLSFYKNILAEIHLPTAAAVLLGLPGGESYFRHEIADNFPLLADALLHQDKQAFIEYSHKIAGMGRGLTPTGDDLLHGALIASHYFADNLNFIESVKKDFLTTSLKTNIFGRHMIEIGLKGLTPEIFKNFLISIALGQPDRAIYKSISLIGSSSGLDVIIAMIYISNELFV
ncbi:MAG: DUF2877 domain-containing protein [Firmicutes bacterium]|nr:DUF2877 domain-containing protein [Bacillota bacterium]